MGAASKVDKHLILDWKADYVGVQGDEEAAFCDAYRQQSRSATDATERSVELYTRTSQPSQTAFGQLSLGLAISGYT